MVKEVPMPQFVMLLLSAVLAMGVGVVQAEDQITVESMPPVVFQTVPPAGEINVDPSIKEIRVSFSKEMMTNDMWSWVMISKESFPNLTGKVIYLEEKKPVLHR
jgi:hypothetical protein